MCVSSFGQSSTVDIVRIGASGTVKDRNWATHQLCSPCAVGGTKSVGRVVRYGGSRHSLIGRNNQPSKSDNDLFLSFKLRALSVYTWARKGLISCCLVVYLGPCEYEDLITPGIIVWRSTSLRAIVSKWILSEQHEENIGSKIKWMISRYNVYRRWWVSRWKTHETVFSDRRWWQSEAKIKKKIIDEKISSSTWRVNNLRSVWRSENNFV